MLIRLSDSARLYHADCRDAIKSLPDNSIDSVVTDPPYALVSIVKRFGGANAKPPKDYGPGNGLAAYARAARGFMGQTWDTGEVAFSEEFWAEVLRVLKPGGHVAAFGASRGYHRMACAIEDAGFEIRDSLMWVYSTGFPKSHQLDRKRGDLICDCDSESPSESPSECDVRPLRGSDVSAQVPYGKMQRQVLQSCLSKSGVPIDGTETTSGGVSALVRTDEPIMEGRGLSSGAQGQLRIDEVRPMSAGISENGASGRVHHGASSGDGKTLSTYTDTSTVRASHGPQPEEQSSAKPRIVAGQPLSQDGGAWSCCGRCGKPMVPSGLGTALKPAFEPIVLARKPLSEGTVAANVLRWGTGALNIDGCRMETSENLNGGAYSGGSKNLADATSYATGVNAGTFVQPLGRWPANVVHDGSDEVVGAFPTTNGSKRGIKDPNGSMGYHGGASGLPGVVGGYDDAGGSAARFFYSAKASRADRAGSKHPTVKPIALMQWLARLITPPGGTVLDPFAGSGTTGAACEREGFDVVLCEREAEYVADIKRRFGTRPVDPLARLLRWNAAVASYRARAA